MKSNFSFVGLEHSSFGGVHSLIHTLKRGLEPRCEGSPGEHIGSKIDPRRAELSGLTSGETPLRVSFLNLSHNFSWILNVPPRWGRETLVSRLIPGLDTAGTEAARREQAAIPE